VRIKISNSCYQIKTIFKLFEKNFMSDKILLSFVGKKLHYLHCWHREDKNGANRAYRGVAGEGAAFAV